MYQLPHWLYILITNPEWQDKYSPCAQTPDPELHYDHYTMITLSLVTSIKRWAVKHDQVNSVTSLQLPKVSHKL